jgi:hypothetical protein
MFLSLSTFFPMRISHKKIIVHLFNIVHPTLVLLVLIRMDRCFIYLIQVCVCMLNLPTHKIANKMKKDEEIGEFNENL